MKKELPGVYAAPINKKMNNNENIYKSTENLERGATLDRNEINKLFNSKEHVYKTRVIVKTREGEFEEDIVGMTNTSLLTLSGKQINLQEIISIKKV